MVGAPQPSGEALASLAARFVTDAQRLGAAAGDIRASVEAALAGS